MRADYYDDTGYARAVLRVGDQPDTEPGPGEAMVRIVASGVNPSDVKSRSGFRVHDLPRVILPSGQAVRLPHTVGFDTCTCFGVPLQTAWRAITYGGPISLGKCC